jgi:Ca2+-binding EF-hand superfamily protein
MFKSLDKNNDGFISKEEAKGSAHEADFAKLDKNGDGKLSRAEHANADAHLAAKSRDTAASAGEAKPATTASASDTSAPKKY